MHIEMRNVADIKPYPHNPRKNDHAVEAVAASIQEFGLLQPLVLDEDGVIVVGHTRFKAALKLGMQQVPVSVVRVGQPVGELGVKEVLQFVGGEAHQVQVEIGFLQLGEFLQQCLVVPVGDLAGLVVGDAVGLQLGRRQSPGDVYRHLLEPKLERRLEAGVAHHDDAVLVQDQRLAEAELLNGSGDRSDGVVVLAGGCGGRA